jgi:hypothetical protein
MNSDKMTTEAPSSLNALLPQPKTVLHLFAGGYIALMAWEIWARTITAWILGNPLEPPGLVISLVQFWTGYTLSLPTATFAHYVVGIAGYPIFYFIVSRSLKRWGLILDLFVWIVFTAFVAYSYVKGGFTVEMGLFWLVVSIVSATRMLNPSSFLANCLSWGTFTWFNALGIFAPLAGLPFLLMEWGGGLSFMSYVGHALFGFIAAYVFETMEGTV